MKRIPRCFTEAPELDSTMSTEAVRERHALLINPFYAKDSHASFGKHVLTPTLALTSIAGATPANWTVEYWDENLLQGPPPHTPFPQVVGITVHLTFAKRAYELAKWYRERGAIVVLGGLHVLSCPEEVRPHADILAVGEGVMAWREIIADIERGAARDHYIGSFREPYADEPPPRRELVPKCSFLTTTSLNATRGCHSRCGFCYLSTKGLHMPYQTLPPEQVVDQWQADESPCAVFTDNNLGSKPEYLRQLCFALRPLEKIWSAAVSVDVADDPSVVREMALAGCTGVFVGFESLSNDNIRDQNKRSPNTSTYAERVKTFHDHGIQVNGSFVLGFDHDDESVFDRTIAWVEEQQLECATFHLLTPYPGTPLFAQMESENRLLHRDWNRYDTAHVVFQPKRMTVEQLQAGYEHCYERLFSAPSIWRRRPDDWRSVPAYLAMSYLYKKSNWYWHLLIQNRLTHLAWLPLVEFTRRRHVQFRKRLETTSTIGRSSSVVSAGV
ncbi:B12-binding domain-containing radical SAM protein [Rhodopirellula bahusiensis]|nr:radical SAM protein [Rhodopirellula bahusiensis]